MTRIDESTPAIDIHPDHWEMVRDILRKHVPKYAVWAFGSRAKWTAKPYSDLDLAVITDKPLPLFLSAALADDFSESNLPWKVDIVDWAATSESFRKIIKRDKVLVQEAGPEHVWSAVRIADIASRIAIGPFGSRLKSDLYTASGVPVIRGTNLVGGRSFSGDWVYVSEETADKLLTCNVVEGDLVFPHRGAIGEVGIVPGNRGRYLLSSSLMMFRCNPVRVDSIFLYYFFKSNIGRFELLKNSSQVGTPGIGQPLSSLKSIEIILPPLAEQRAIAHILEVLDEKIELNRRMNQTLEAMARALFKSWFVDFDGVPREDMQESELGLIPKGWKVVSFGDLLEGSIGGDWGKEQPEGDEDQPVNIIRGTDFSSLKNGGRGGIPTRYTNNKKLVSRVLQAGDIVIEVSGGSPTQPTGRSLRISESTLARFDSPVVCASFCRRLRPKSLNLGALAACHLDYLYKTGGTWEYQNQSTGISNFQTTHFFVSEKIAVPPSVELQNFFNLVSPIFESLANNQILALSQLRDTLLPKLISGELRVKDVERIAETA